MLSSRKLISSNCLVDPSQDFFFKILGLKYRKLEFSHAEADYHIAWFLLGFLLIYPDNLKLIIGLLICIIFLEFFNLINQFLIKVIVSILKFFVICILISITFAIVLGLILVIRTSSRTEWVSPCRFHGCHLVDCIHHHLGSFLNPWCKSLVRTLLKAFILIIDDLFRLQQRKPAEKILTEIELLNLHQLSLDFISDLIMILDNVVHEVLQLLNLFVG